MRNSNWYYQQTKPGLWTVGHDDSAGKWHADSDHSEREQAAKRCHYLNGGNQTEPGNPECLAGNCTYHKHYLVWYNPDVQGTKLDHIAYHHAEEQCSKAQKNVSDWMDAHEGEDWNNNSTLAYLEKQATFWEIKVAA